MDESKKLLEASEEAKTAVSEVNGQTEQTEVNVSQPDENQETQKTTDELPKQKSRTGRRKSSVAKKAVSATENELIEAIDDAAAECGVETGPIENTVKDQDNPETENGTEIMPEAKKTKKEKKAEKRRLCKLVKKDYLKKNFKEYKALVMNPKYICHKCGRTAHDQNILCKPVSLEV